MATAGREEGMPFKRPSLPRFAKALNQVTIQALVALWNLDHANSISMRSRVSIGDSFSKLPRFRGVASECKGYLETRRPRGCLHRFALSSRFQSPSSLPIHTVLQQQLRHDESSCCPLHYPRALRPLLCPECHSSNNLHRQLLCGYRSGLVYRSLHIQPSNEHHRQLQEPHLVRKPTQHSHVERHR